MTLQNALSQIEDAGSEYFNTRVNPFILEPKNFLIGNQLPIIY